ncbi:hypothetical protein ONS95_014459 [Cadophora gregata]|uniref:uncharacterized protein n=1 Tax=Cadophora gregata TaxID=51156 RepID=UPI0026DC29C4|nr:uncharacterized protein ONS95_014459 [Cadophora gregata]KAK0112723.1 hypothetical protein ONS95_014459 [Cadophora gregata]
MRGGQEEKKPQKMVRSSIACARCRRSKVKCVNNGVHSTCKACASSNRDCTYPIAGSTPAPKRNEPPMGIKQEGDIGESKKRVRKLEDHGRRNSTRPGEDVLESPILTRKVWDELFEIFKLHFSTEMPFLHPPTFRNRMRQAAYPRDPSTSLADLEDGRVLLLGVLTLTARFHPGLVAYHSPNHDDPLAASEYYAVPLAAAFGPTIRNLTIPSLENIQALLMLGLYEWGQTRGLSAWLYVGLAIRLAFPMGLAYEDDPDQKSHSLIADTRKPSKQPPSPREDAIEKEVRRRTVWSCFIMDRMLAAGKYRPTMMSVNKLRVQLPCSDDQFLFVRNVKTGFLDSDWLDSDSSEYDSTVNDDGVLSRFIRLVDIFGRLSEYSYAGGRRAEKRPPWDESTQFFQLRQQLKDFNDALPSNLTYTEANLSAHIEKRNATTYASLHTLYSLCLIMLHREYIPFIPIRCEKPVGPLDEPTFPEDKYTIPPGFWEESAEGIMKASRDIVEIVKTCQEDNVLPESPLMGFAIYQASFVCLYAAHFPQMDMACHLVPEGSLNPIDNDSGLAEVTRKMLSEMVPRLKMVRGYLKTLPRMRNYFQRVVAEYCCRFKRKPFFAGGGLEEYKKYEKLLKEFGELKDSDQMIGSDVSDTVDQSRSRASTNDLVGPGTNGEPMQGIEAVPQQRPNGAWAPINAASPSIEVDERPKYNYGPSPYGMPSYQQSPNQSSNAPSLISPSNGESTPGINSPYANVQQYQQPNQPQHVAAYPSVAQHTMAPPTVQQQYPSDEEYKKWIGDQEAIRMNTGFDNFAQENPGDAWVLQQDSRAIPNHMQVVWSSTMPMGGPLAGATWT